VKNALLHLGNIHDFGVSRRKSSTHTNDAGTDQRRPGYCLGAMKIPAAAGPDLPDDTIQHKDPKKELAQGLLPTSTDVRTALSVPRMAVIRAFGVRGQAKTHSRAASRRPDSPVSQQTLK
jgi:hypothetical protein